MIRPFAKSDTEEIVRLWFEASVQAHSFIAWGYWEAARESMRTLYLPMSDEIVVHVSETSGEVDAFLAFVGDFLAALFVAPSAQGQGLGKRLLRVARRMHPHLTLAVYRENERAVRFYRQNGLVVCAERLEAHTGHWELLMGVPAPD